MLFPLHQSLPGFRMQTGLPCFTVPLLCHITLGLSMQAEGFTIIEGTSQMTAAPASAAAEAAADQAAENAELPEDEIAWEVVESAAPAAEVPNAAPPGDSLSSKTTAACKRVSHRRFALELDSLTGYQSVTAASAPSVMPV